MQRSDLGPRLDEWDVLARVLKVTKRDLLPVCPAEVTAAMGRSFCVATAH
ncbi:hypothetical protein [uncultured Tateyamaria sp.]|nr:hypothetical protein [uncultured Tateyamaria sp.]